MPGDQASRGGGDTTVSCAPRPRLTRREVEAAIIDCTEQPIERPGEEAIQSEHYSGKKKRHTPKTEYAVTGEGRITSISQFRPGSRHGLTFRRDGPKLPKRARLYVDSAYQGYDKEYPNIDFPYREPKDGELTEEKKQYDRGPGSFPVAVEHRIGRCKRFRIVSEHYRNPLRTHHTKTAIVDGLVNNAAGFEPF